MTATKLLHIDSSILGDNSASRAITAAAVERLRELHPGVEVTHRDLAAAPIDHLTLEAYGQLAEGEDLREFLEADIVVIGAGFYNFTIPTQLKAWLDRIVVRGTTFSYDENGVKGLVAGKRVVVALARGNVYHSGSPFAAYEHGETLLRTILGFIGLGDAQYIIAEGIGRGEDARKAAIEGAVAEARQLTAGEPVAA